MGGLGGSRPPGPGEGLPVEGSAAGTHPQTLPPGTVPRGGHVLILRRDTTSASENHLPFREVGPCPVPRPQRLPCGSRKQASPWLASAGPEQLARQHPLPSCWEPPASQGSSHSQVQPQARGSLPGTGLHSPAQAACHLPSVGRLGVHTSGPSGAGPPQRLLLQASSPQATARKTPSSLPALSRQALGLGGPVGGWLSLPRL